MTRLVSAAVLGVALIGMTAAQDPGRPVFPRPGQLASAYVQNNTWRPVRFVVSSSTGATTGVLAAGHFGEFTFANDGRPRVLTTFDVRGGGIISLREIELHPNHVYLANSPAFPVGPVTGPGGGGGPVRGTAAPAKDKGTAVQPGQLRNVTKVK
jgi:hypothetical protein